MLRSTTLRLSCGLIKQFQRTSSSTPNPALSSDKITEEIQEVANISSTTVESAAPSIQTKKEKGNIRSNLITNAFATLQHNQPQSKITNPLDENIKAAKTSEELLTLSQNSVLTKRQAMKIVTTLSEWSLNGKGGNSDFESDPRFISLCQMLTKSSGRLQETEKEGDLSVVLGIMGEDEATKMVKSITIPQMIRVLSSLAYKRRRSLPLLRALAFGIGSSSDKLDVKQSADILYAQACLNFPDEVLLEKVCSDLVETIPLCQKSAVIGSICTSIGLLRYKDVELLNSLCEWGLKNKSIGRLQDFVSLLLCLASVNHIPEGDILNVIQEIVTENDVPSASTWLDVVWALSVLQSSSESHISSVLKPKFVERLSTSGNLTTSWKKKLLNVNGIAKFTKGYKGPLLNTELDIEVPVKRSKDKQLIFSSVVDTLSNILPSPNHYRTTVETGMGFVIDAECVFDSKLNPVSLIDKKTGQPIVLNKSSKRIALIINDYHDCTRGSVEPCGAASFNKMLAELAGYKVISLLYKDYSPQTKLLDRAKHIEGLLKTAATDSST